MGFTPDAGFTVEERDDMLRVETEMDFSPPAGLLKINVPDTLPHWLSSIQSGAEQMCLTFESWHPAFSAG